LACRPFAVILLLDSLFATRRFAAIRFDEILFAVILLLVSPAYPEPAVKPRNSEPTTHIAQRPGSFCLFVMSSPRRIGFAVQPLYWNKRKRQKKHDSEPNPPTNLPAVAQSHNKSWRPIPCAAIRDLSALVRRVALG